MNNPVGDFKYQLEDSSEQVDYVGFVASNLICTIATTHHKKTKFAILDRLATLGLSFELVSIDQKDIKLGVKILEISFPTTNFGSQSWNLKKKKKKNTPHNYTRFKASFIVCQQSIY